jgi:MFS family permease
MEDTPEFTPALSVYNERTNKRKTQLLENSNLTDKAAALMNVSFSSGALLGPLISGVFYDFFDFEVVSLIVAGYTLLIAILYLIFSTCSK